MTDNTENASFYQNAPDPTRSEAQGEKLPFDALNVWWVNGSAAHKAAGGPRYFGGWEVSAEQVAESTWGLPKSWEQYEAVGKDGSPYPAYGSRVLTLALIAKREKFTNYDDKNDVKLTFGQGYSSHTQTLGAMFFDKALTDFIPVVVTTKGVNAGKMNKAIKTWKEALGKANSAWRNYSLMAFALTFGTKGTEREQVSVGKGDKKSWIVPIQPLIFNIETRLIGRATVEAMLNLRMQAEPWLDDWRKRYGGAPDGAEVPGPSGRPSSTAAEQQNVAGTRHDGVDIPF